jgi:hypothetical protein
MSLELISEISLYDAGFSRRESCEDQKQEAFQNQTRLSKPYQDGRQHPCTCHTWSSYSPILKSKSGKKKMLNQYLSTPNMHESLSRLDMITFCHQIPRVSLVSSLSCRRDQESHSGEEHNMSASFRREEREKLERYIAYGEEKEREMYLFKYSSLALM